MKRTEVDREKISPMMRQYLEIKDSYEDAILFYRLGDFYEMFFEDAKIASKELEIVLTSRNASLDQKIPMAGIPYHSYLPYLENLVSKGYKVAICEQLTDPKESKGMVERGVVQVVSKGTILEDGLLKSDNNYIASVYDFEHCYGLSFADISTGEISTLIVKHDSQSLISEILKRGIVELIVSDNIDRQIINDLRHNYQLLISISSGLYEENNYAYIYQNLQDIRLVTSIKHLLFYIFDNKKGDLRHFQKAQEINLEKYLEFDLASQRNLELVENSSTLDKTHSLFWLLDKTSTAMGTRLLKYNILNPLRDPKELNRRYEFIEKLLTEFILKADLEMFLKEIYDLERIISRVNYGNINGRDLLQLKQSLRPLPQISLILEELNYDQKLIDLSDLYNLLESAINENAPLTIKEGSLIKAAYNKNLDELNAIRSGSKDFLLQLEQEEKERTGIKNLKLGFNKVFGYYIEISNTSLKDIKEEFNYERKQTLVNAERFITPVLKEKEEIILNAEEKIFALEYELFLEIRDEVQKYTGKLQDVAKKIAEIDMFCSLTTVAEANSYIRPILTEDNKIKIIDSRHPVVEKVIQEDYVLNDVKMDEEISVLLITGPNMAGKSTYMRQVALTAIMAQIGSFVPASSCTIPIFDKIFTRIGSRDDLVAGDSSFMIEMKEANNALMNATKKSLIVLDELGRGTATFDGMSLAQAILEYIHDKIGAKTLFSTHYHELTSISSSLKNLRNVHVSAVKKENDLIFLHKVKNGPIDKSYGIQVASLAHLPNEVLERAEEILSGHEKNSPKTDNFTQTSLFLEEKKTDLEQQLIEELKEVDPLTMTPIEAMNKLYDLKKEIENHE